MEQDRLHCSAWGEEHDARLVLVHGSLMTDDPAVDDWPRQQSFGETYHVIMPARHGYYRSPRAPHEAFDVYTAALVDVLAPGAAHLVGFSYGGVVAMLAATRRPDLIRSFTVIEPPVFQVAADDPAVEQFLARMMPVALAAPTLTPEEYLLRFRNAIADQYRTALTAPEQTMLATAFGRRGIEASLREVPPWEAPLDLAALAATAFPKQVFSGNWSPAFEAVCDVLQAQLSAERHVLSGVGHGVQFADGFNERLADLLHRAD